MANNNRVDIKIGYSVDKNGLNDLKKQLIDLRLEAEKAKIGGNLTKGLDEASKAASKLEDILDKSWNSKLNQLDLSKVNNGIKTTFGNVEKLKKAFSDSGAAGATAYNSFAISVLNTNTQLKRTSETLDKMAITFKNTVRYGISSAVFNTFTNSIQRAYEYTKELDSSLNDIRIVTGKSAEEMDKFAVRANKVAKELGRSTKDFTNAALIYYQQGLGNEEAQARAEVTMKAANVTGQSGREVSEQLTAVWNGYKVTAEEAELYVDKLAAVAAGTAADLEELSTGMSKVASAANLMGVDIDQLNAQLATIVSVTRQAPESVGTALKTIYARMGDIEAGLDDEVTLGKYTEEMAQMGINVLDANGKLRDMGVVIEEIGEKWTTMSREQQIALSQTMAGTRQYNNLLSLFDNWDMYVQSLEMSANAAGTLQKQQDIYMESTEAHLQKLSTEAEKTYDILFDTDAVNGFADALTGVLGIFNNLLAGLGGGINDFVFFGSTIANIFNKQIGQSIERQIENIEIMRTNIDKANIQKQIISMHSIRGENVTNASALDLEANLMERTLQLQGSLTEEQSEQLTNETAKIGLLEQQIQGILKYKKIAKQYNIEEADSYEDWKENFQNRIDEEKTELQIETDKKSILQESLDMYQEGAQHAFATDKDRQITKDLLADSVKKITKYDKEDLEIQKILKTVDNGRELSEEQIQYLLKLQSQSETEIANKVRELENGLQGVKDDEKYIVTELEQERDLRVQNVKETQNQIERQKMLSELTQGLSAIISLGTSLIGIFKTLNDDSLSSSEKLERILTVVASTIPMVLMNLTALGNLIPNITKGMATLATTMGVEGVTAASSFGAALSGILVTIAPYLIAIAAVVAIGYTLVKVWNADADAADRASDSLKVITESYNKAKEAADELKKSIGNYDNEVKALEELKEGTEEYTKALEKANEEAKKLIETYSLYDEYYYENGLIKFNEDALKNAQNKANDAASALKKQTYLAREDYDQKSLRANQTELRRSTGLAFNASGLWNDFLAPVTGGLTLLDDAIGVTDNEISSIITTLQKLKESNEIEYNYQTRSTEAFAEWVKTTYSGNERMQLLANNIGEQVSSFKALIAQTDELTKSQKRYAEQINLEDLTNKYGQHYTELLGNTGSAEQVLNLLNQTDVEQIARDMKNRKRTSENFLQYITNGYGEDARDAQLWSREFSRDNKNTLVTDTLKSIGMTDQDLIDKLGYSSLTSNRQLAEAWAKINNKNLDNATFKGDKFIDTEGNTLVDVSSAELRGTIRESIVETIGMAFQDAKVDQMVESMRETNAKMLDDLIEQAKVGGEKYGVDFSSTVLNYLSNPDNGFNLNSLVGKLNPTEVQAIQEMTPEEISTMLGLTPAVLSQWTNKTTADIAKEFQEAAKNMPWDIDAAIEEEFNNLQDKMPEGLTKKKMAEYSEDIKEYARYLMDIAEEEEEVIDKSDDLADTLKEDAKSAVIVSNSIIRMNSGIDKLAKSQKDWINILKKSGVESKEYFDALTDIRDAIGDLFDLSQDTEKYFDGEFFADNAELIEQAAEGSAEAIESLRAIAAEKVLLEIAIDNGLSKDEATTFRDWLINTYLPDIQSQIPNFKVGADFDFDGIDESEQKFIDKCQEIVNAANMTADQASAFFETMGFETEFETETKPVVKEGRGTRTVTELKPPMDVTMPDGSIMKVPSGWETKTYPGEPYQYVDYVDAIAMTTDGSHPKIKSFTRKGTANLNNYSSKNSGGGAPGGSSGKSGGGGGGSSKVKDPDHKDLIEGEADRYKKVDAELASISSKIQKLETQKNKLFGKDLIENINQQLKLLDKNIETITEKIKIAENEEEELRQKLEASGTIFDEDGIMLNYADVFATQLKIVNDAIDNYNGMTAEQQEAEKKNLDEIQKNWEQWQKDVDRQITLRTKEIPALYEDNEKDLNEKITKQIEKFDMEVQIRLDMSQAERDWNEFKKTVIDGIEEDDIWGNANAKLLDFSSYYKDNDKGIVQVLTNQIYDTINELDKMSSTGWSDVFGNDKVKGLDKLKEYYTTLMSNLTDVQKLQKEIHESYMDMQDEAQDKFDKQIETYEMISDLIDHDMKVIQLVYGDESYSALGKYYQKQEENNNKQLDFQRQQVEFWRRQMEATKDMPKEWENAKEKWEDAVKNLNSLIEDSIENLQDKYLNAINEIFYNLNNRITDNQGLEYINEEWTLINKNADQYLDSINALYETQALENKYLDAIDKTNNIGAQRQLKELMDAELADLRERDKLTQYDIDRANKKYEIALKQIALQEAQQNKTKMRLRRDSQGNYRYEYTTDSDQVNQIQDELNSLYNSLYNFDKARYQDNLSQVYSVWVEFQEKMTEAAQINDPQRRAEREALLQEEYGKLINGLVEQNTQIRLNLQDSAFKDLARLYDKDVTEYTKMIEEEKNALMNDLVPQWKSGVQQMTDKFAGSGGFIGTCKEALKQLHNATKDYEKSLDELENTADKDFNSIYNGVDRTIDITKDLITENDTLIEQYDAQMKKISLLIGDLDALEKKYQKVAEEAKKAAQAGYEYTQKEKDMAADEARNDANITWSVKTAENSAQPNEPSHSEARTISNNDGIGDGILSIGDMVTYTGGDYFETADGTGRHGTRGPGKSVKVTSIVNGKPYPIHVKSSDSAYGWLKRSQLSGYDTGGYTGAWGNDGRLALLHQKELVLNASDTENMLNAVTIMRDITSTLGNSVLNRLAGIAAANANGTANGGLLDQNVSIQATFPNVTSSREIEDALNNLVNMAAIRANKKGS